MIRGTVLAAAFTFLLAAASLEKMRQGERPKTLIELSSQEADFRGCDRANPPDERPTAEVDFRANDRDWCHVNDFWTAEVVGLYSMASTAESATDPAIKLIELSIASADVDEESPD